ncbi:MAG TPA: glycosyltransferase [candidate division Zixibacteria bacterium]|nr:glycosyltransferase [candidate division Zixibacteria bacterium]
MRIFAFGSSITSCYWNGAATYYRGIYRNLAALGHEVTFAEPDIFERQQHRDVSEVEYANVIIYQTPRDLPELVALASTADLVIKHSGVGADDTLLEQQVLTCRSAHARVAWWDVDAPATLDSVHSDPHKPFRFCIPQYDLIFTYGGGAPVVEQYLALGARNCYPIYNALDPDTHFPAEPRDDWRCDLLLVANRLPDRERRIEEFFLRAARLAPEMTFLLGGEGWGGKPMPNNVRWVGHIGTGDHNVINASARIVLNVNRESMASTGFSPPTRIFEAAGAGACMITDKWRGVEEFFTPGIEILLASGAEDVVRHLRETSAQRAREIGNAMRERALRSHTYKLRAQQVQSILQSSRRDRHPSVIDVSALAS